MIIDDELSEYRFFNWLGAVSVVLRAGFFLLARSGGDQVPPSQGLAADIQQDRRMADEQEDEQEGDPARNKEE